MIFNQGYQGSNSLLFISNLTQLSIDQVNFIVCQLLALVLSYILRRWIHQSSIRLIYTLVSGISISVFCFGSEILHIFISATLSYIFIQSIKSNLMPWIVLVISMGYLSFLHMKRQFYDHSGYALDVTGPLMILTQKMSSLAFSISDGIEEKKNNCKLISEIQKQRIIYKVPDTLTFWSYVFQFQSLLAGPFIFYNDYFQYIHQSNKIGNPSKQVGIKFIQSIFFATIFLGLGKTFHINNIQNQEFLENSNTIYKMIYIIICTTVERCKYYHAWILADAVCNMSGLGYNELTGLWDGVSNVHPFSLELSLNMKELLDNWNIGTMKWLRHVIYERTPSNHRTNLVYMISAIWHGFYPGYYITFLSGALFTQSGRIVRRYVRPIFMNKLKKTYDALTWLGTRMILAYVTFPFVIQEFYISINVYIRMYFFLHVIAVLSLYGLPILLNKKKSIQD